MTSGTRIDEIREGVFRISTSIPPQDMPGGFTFNQFLVVDEEPLLYHTGGRRLFPAVRRAIETRLPLDELRWVAFARTEPALLACMHGSSWRGDGARLLRALGARLMEE